ncbi:hypothetical protein UlMin_041470 [Ulmus minor]
MMDFEALERKNKIEADPFTDTVFSWSLEDISNETLYKDKVERIPETFKSANHYLGSFVYPLLEETRAEVCSSMDALYKAPFAHVTSFEESKPRGTRVYDIGVDYWRNRFNRSSKELYKTLPGDLLVLTNVKPETSSDLERAGTSWAFLSVTKITEDEDDDDSTSTYFKVRASKDSELETEMHNSLFVIFLVNITSQKRVWKALRMQRNVKILNDVLSVDSAVSLLMLYI